MVKVYARPTKLIVHTTTDLRVPNGTVDKVWHKLNVILHQFSDDVPDGYVKMFEWYLNNIRQIQTSYKP